MHRPTNRAKSNTKCAKSDCSFSLKPIISQEKSHQNHLKVTQTQPYCINFCFSQFGDFKFFSLAKWQQHYPMVIWRPASASPARLASTKFLGFIISEDLKRKEHISIVANKISKSLLVLNKVRNILLLECYPYYIVLSYYLIINIVMLYGQVITQLIYITCMHYRSVLSILSVSVNGMITLLYQSKTKSA